MLKNDLEKAIEILNVGYTCVLCHGDVVHKSTDRGVRPLIEMLDGGYDFRGFSAADKIAGRAAAFIYVMLGIKEIYAHVMSEGAADIFAKYGIHAECGTLVKEIINRDGTGICPMDAGISGITESEQAVQAIKAKMSEFTHRF